MTTDNSRDRLDRIVARAQTERDLREQDYHARALKMYPWICGRCALEFTRENLRELTVHHRDHNHDNNPPDGSNWELLCVYCHDNEHARYLEPGHGESRKDGKQDNATYNPIADLGALLKQKKQGVPASRQVRSSAAGKKNPARWRGF